MVMTIESSDRSVTEPNACSAVEIFAYARLTQRFLSQYQNGTEIPTFHQALQQFPTERFEEERDVSTLEATAIHLAEYQRTHLDLEMLDDAQRRKLLLAAIEEVYERGLEATVVDHGNLLAGVRFSANPNLRVVQSVLATEERQRRRVFEGTSVI